MLFDSGRKRRLRPLSSEHEVEYELGVGRLAVVRELVGFRHSLRNASLDLIELRLVGDAGLRELRGVTVDRVFLLPLLDFLELPILAAREQLLLELHVTLDAVRLRLDVAGPL